MAKPVASFFCLLTKLLPRSPRKIGINLDSFTVGRLRQHHQNKLKTRGEEKQAKSLHHNLSQSAEISKLSFKAHSLEMYSVSQRHI